MGYTYADLTLLNTGDEEMVRRNLMPEANIRTVRVNALVDSGCATLAVNEKIKDQLGLAVLRTSEGVLANGLAQIVEVVGPVTIRFMNRQAICQAICVPGTDEVLLGVIPIEEMDVIIDPVKQELTLPADRPYLSQMKLK
ncbi:hypothetical protein FACS1894170_05280 [Planctomycetales bacterium]|nr:hypothetical protein FACS1894170_05280 [Planctomycetales bacterium]